MIRIGITGGIGSGKTHVCNMLALRGIPVYNCDNEAKRLMVESSEIRHGLCQLIGTNAYVDGALNKAAVAGYLFQNAEHARLVGNIVHPVVKQDFLGWAARQNAPLVVQECALLFEADFRHTVHYAVEVYAPLPVRLERATKRDRATEEQIKARMAQQMDEEEKRNHADFCILNDGTAALDPQIDRLLQNVASQALKDS